MRKFINNPKMSLVFIFAMLFSLSLNGRVVINKSTDKHIIKRNESLMVISFIHFGTHHCWDVLHKLNPQIKDPNIIEKGESIKIPSAKSCKYEGPRKHVSKRRFTKKHILKKKLKERRLNAFIFFNENGVKTQSILVNKEKTPKGFHKRAIYTNPKLLKIKTAKRNAWLRKEKIKRDKEDEKKRVIAHKKEIEQKRLRDIATAKQKIKEKKQKERNRKKRIAKERKEEKERKIARNKEIKMAKLKAIKEAKRKKREEKIYRKKRIAREIEQAKQLVIAENKEIQRQKDIKFKKELAQKEFFIAKQLKAKLLAKKNLLKAKEEEIKVLEKLKLLEANKKEEDFKKRKEIAKIEEEARQKVIAERKEQERMKELSHTIKMLKKKEAIQKIENAKKQKKLEKLTAKVKNQYLRKIKKVKRTVASISVKPYTIQVAAYARISEAKQLNAELNEQNIKSRIETITSDSKEKWYRIRTGEFKTVAEAKRYVKKKNLTYYVKDYYVAKRK